MRTNITRTINVSTIKSSIVKFEKGTPVVVENKPLTVNGVISEDKALKEVRKVYGQNAQIVEIAKVNDVYEISVEDFMEHATKVTPKEG